MFENFVAPDSLKPSDPRFGCGPSLIPLEFLDRLKAHGPHLLGTSHRKSAVKNVVKEIQEGLRSYFNLSDDKSVLLGNGGATFLFDMLALGMVNKKTVHYTCGEFSQKWYKASAKVPWIEAIEKKVDFGHGQNAQVIGGEDFIATTLNETSTGVQIGQLPKVDASTILAVDATSGAGQCPIDIEASDVYFFSPQKVFASEGGLWVAIVSNKARERALKIEQDKQRYIPEIMSWKLAIENSDLNQTYNTPSITGLFFLAEQIKDMNKLGQDQVVAQAHKKAKHVYDWAESRPYLSAYVKDPEFRSISVATINVDEKYPMEDLLKVLHKQKVVYGIEAYRKLGKNQLRISLFHNIKFDDLEKLTTLISKAIEGV